ncbi:MAG: D-tyrosyl-tRNA(Tyr) deacylase [Anaerolineales bacterium]|nr:D-tyrosyl-tRNA(Tyr) deacylase [Anaerolineales bacterium]
MKLVIQRVTSASVHVNDRVVGEIQSGLLILVGITHGDNESQAQWLAQKVAGLRIFEDDEGKFNISLKDAGGSALVVSQFTLYGDSRKGRRPSFTDAAPPEIAEPLIERFCELLRLEGIPVETGVFGERMLVTLQNNGPVTMILER